MIRRRQQRGGRPGILLLVLLLALALSACVLASKQAAIGCQVADIASTQYCLHNNPNCYETNALAGNQNLLYALKLGLAWFIYQWEGWKDAPESMRALVSIVGCAPVPGNVRIGREGS